MDLFEEVYDYKINEGLLKKIADKKSMEEEIQLYDYLRKSLKDEFKEKFISYAELLFERERKNIKNAYIQGIKDGAKMALFLTEE